MASRFDRFRTVFWLFAASSLSLVPQSAWCFPFMVRHGYINCSTCHINPNGGGVLTQYGRELSREILSTWGTQNEWESKFAYGVVPIPDWLSAMGMYRGAYAYQNTPYVEQGQYIFMQNDLEAAATYKQWFLDAALGYENKLNDVNWYDHFISRRHFLGYHPTEDTEVRLGRFYPSVGINFAEHVVPTRKNLGWDEGQETYNLETAYIGEKYNVFLTYDFGRPDKPDYHRETGFGFSPSMGIADSYKVGLSYFYGNGYTTTRNVIGPWGILGFMPHFSLETELDFQQQSNKDGTGSQWGIVNFQRLDYEVIQGLHLLLTQDLSRLNFANSGNMQNSFGAGFEFFPRPHFDFQFIWNKLKDSTIADQYTDYAWFMINFYL